MTHTKNIFINILSLLLAFFMLSPSAMASSHISPNPQNGSLGLEGTIPSPPPKVAATITFPSNGRVFTEIPINVTGICQSGLLVKLFKNNIFSGSDLCVNGSYEITTDLFSGTNDLVARVFDSLDQPGPDSNTVRVTYDDSFGTDGAYQRVTIKSNYAKRGANPNETLTWPLSISGGTTPFAVQVDWGDGLEDLISRAVAGEFTISHIYKESGVYRIIIKVTDGRDQTGFLQLIGIINGPLGDAVGTVGDDGSVVPAGRVIYKWALWPLYIMLFLIVSTFWLGRKYEIKKLKQRIYGGQSLF